MRFLGMLWKCITVWEVKPATEEELIDADVIIALSDSKMRDGSLGEGNKIIGQKISELRYKYFLPIIAQEEAALAAADVSLYPVNPEYIIRGMKDGKSHLAWNTAVIMDYARDICRKEGLIKPIIVAIPDHMPRCVWHAEKRGLIALASSMPKGRYYHKNLALPSCRGGSFRFRFRDFFVRIMFLFFGDI